jgi:hypothetical protein
VRFDEHAADRAGATGYLRERAHQILMDGFWPVSDELEPLIADGSVGQVAAGQEWGLRALARDRRGVVHQSVYVYAPWRGRGLVMTALGDGRPVVTTPGCRLEGLLAAKRIPYVLAAHLTASAEYLAIEEVYGARTARRSQVPLMHHIDEGLAVLRWCGSSEAAQRAFCLHPLLQEDAALAAHLERVRGLTSPHVLALALEYRRVANATLSTRPISSAAEIDLSPMPEVNAMLVADKVQNRKDFELHHRGRHPRSAELERYFRRWLARLEVSEARFAELFEQLQVTAAPVRWAER